MKLAVIGAGSTYTPELVSGLMRERERLDLRELVLHDIDPRRLEVVGGLAQRMLERQGYRGALALTGALDDALDGASFVLIQLRVGGPVPGLIGTAAGTQPRTALTPPSLQGFEAYPRTWKERT